MAVVEGGIKSSDIARITGKFTKEVLVDGQHRLAAIVMADVPVQSVVVRHAPMNAYETIDNGKRRTLGDALSLEGEVSYEHLSAVITIYFYYEKRQMTGWRMPPSVSQALKILEENPIYVRR